MVIAGGHTHRGQAGDRRVASTEPAMVIAGGTHVDELRPALAGLLQRSRRW